MNKKALVMNAEPKRSNGRRLGKGTAPATAKGMAIAIATGKGDSRSRSQSLALSQSQAQSQSQSLSRSRSPAQRPLCLPRLRAASFLGARIATAFAFVAAFVPAAARADFYGADIPLLTALVSNGAEQLVQMSNSLKALQRTYNEAKRVAGYADEAARAFNSVKTLNGQLFGQSVVNGLGNAFPEVARIQNDLQGHSQWAQSTGELGLLLTGCARYGPNTPACTQFQRAVTATDARTAISNTFGIAPTGPNLGARRAQAIDDDAAVGLATSASQVGRGQVTRAQAQALMDACAGVADDDSIAACQAAANAAQIQGLSHQSHMADQMAVQTRLHADQLAAENARHKQELVARDAQTAFLKEASERGQPGPTQVRTAGADFFGDGK